MRLSSLHLRNIRSYSELRLELVEGITILSGDIGTGKSTILSAVEFALFGLSRSELSGQALLRHGEDSGEVTLQFLIGDQEYAIQRTLRRGKQGVVQDSGWYEENGLRESLTPSELRARIFALLGYPLHHLGKQRNMLYRFTVYTPQEELKSILTEEPEERIEVIRRIFGVDAYRIARENAQLVARALKEQATHARETRDRIDAELASLQERREGSLTLLAQRATIAEELAKAHARLRSAEEKQARAQADAAKADSQMQVLAMQERERANRTVEVERFTRIVKEKETQLVAHAATVLATTQKEAELAALVATPAEELARRAFALRGEIDALRKEEGRLSAMHDAALPITIEAGAICPTCQQEVGADHLSTVHASLEAKRRAIQAKRVRVQEDLRVKEEAFTAASGAMEHARQLASIRERLELQRKMEREATLARDDARAHLLTEQAALARLPPAQDAQAITAARTAAGEALTEAARALAHVRKDVLDLERRNAALDAEARVLKELEERYAAVTRSRVEADALLARADKARTWLLERFTPFTSTVEEKVLASVYGTFSHALGEWVSRLLEDDSLAVRMDTSFGPLVEQHGYETATAHLSGGERTALSLGYRLALVHTIHTLLPHLGTAGLVILDEPTEGFSVEQLDKLRDVLSSLKMEQVLLVSHDPQMETLADTVIRVHKTSAGSVAEAL